MAEEATRALSLAHTERPSHRKRAFFVSGDLSRFELKHRHLDRPRVDYEVWAFLVGVEHLRFFLVHAGNDRIATDLKNLVASARGDHRYGVHGS